MSEPTLELIKALIDGAVGSLGARVDGMSREMSAGFTGTHRRIDELTDKVQIQNGRVLEVEKIISRNTQRITYLESAVQHQDERQHAFGQHHEPHNHRRAYDDGHLPDVAHARDGDRPRSVLEKVVEQAAVKYGAVLVAGAGGLKFLEWFIRLIKDATP